MKLFRLFLFLGFGVAAYSQGTPYDCFSVFSFTAVSSQAGQNNSSSTSPCVAWRVTYTTTGFSTVTLKFQTSPDNSSWSDVTNSICSSSVQPPCVTDGANPLDAGVMGSASFRVYAKYVRVSVTSVTGSGTGQAVIYGYKGTSASAALGGGGGGGDSPFSCTVTAVSSIACTHNLGTSYPWVTCFDNGTPPLQLGSAGTSTSVIAIAATSSNIATITFSGSTTGVCKITTGGLGPAGPDGPSGPMPDPGSNGFYVRTALDTAVSRTLQEGVGISITNPTGVSGNPVITSNLNIYYLNSQGNITGNGTLFSKSIAGNTITAGQCFSVEASIRSVTYSAGQVYTLNWGSDVIPFLNQPTAAFPVNSYFRVLVCNNPGSTSAQQINWAPGTFAYGITSFLFTAYDHSDGTQDTTGAVTLSLTMTGGNGSDVNKLDYVKITGPV